MAKNALAHLFETAAIDWKAVYVGRDQDFCISCTFPLTPEDFLSFGREDLRAGGVRGYVSAVSNAKRAADCQVDAIVTGLGYNPQCVEKQLGTAASIVRSETNESRLPFNYRFVASLGIITPEVVERLRVLRHGIEHQYRRPTRRQAADALGIASLFVGAAQGAVAQLPESWEFGSGTVKLGSALEIIRFTVSTRIHPDADEPHAEINYWDRSTLSELSKENLKVEVSVHHPSYYGLLRASSAISRGRDEGAALNLLISLSGARVPKLRFHGYV
jgi:hypothetical protein